MEGGDTHRMRISKVVNNNVLQVMDEKKQELVVMGKGLGFQKKANDIVDPAKVEKTFVLKSTEANLAQIFDEVSPAEVDVVYEIIALAEKELNQDYQANLLITLTDHIHFAIERTKKNEPVKNPMSWQVRRIYKAEYKVGLKAVELIEHRLGVGLDNTEAASIALHIINAQKEGNEIKKTMKMVSVVENIVKIVELHYSKKFDEDSISYSRFITHLQFFAQRINDEQLYNSNEDTFLFEQVAKNYPKAFTCSEKIKQYVEKTYEYPIGHEEQAYLTIHIQRVAN